MERLRGLEDDSVAAAAKAAEADTAASATLAALGTFDEGHFQLARQAAQQAEKEAHGLSRDVAQLKERLESADYISSREKVIKTAKEQMDVAQAVRDAAVTAHEVRREEQHTVDKTFANSSGAGSPKVATNVALLLALRDT